MKKIFSLVLAFIIFTNVSLASTIDAGYSNSVVVDDGVAYRFGMNFFAELGNKMFIRKLLSSELEGLPRVKQVALGLDYFLILLENGDVYQAGSNGYGKIGNTYYGQDFKPNKLEGVSNIVQVSVGRSHAMFLDNNGNVYALGNNQKGQLGSGNTINEEAPIKVYSGDVKKVECGENFTYILLNNGKLLSFGANNSGQLALGNNANYIIPTEVNTIDNVKDISCSNSFANVSVRINGTLNFGDGTSKDVYNISHLLSKNFTLILKNDGTVFGTGLNRKGQLGLGNYVYSYNAPTKIPIENVKAISAGSNFSLFLKENGEVYSCGVNNVGQLGLGNYFNTNIPTKLNVSGVNEISAGFAHAILKKANGEIWGFGLNKYGAISRDDFVKVENPIKVNYDFKHINPEEKNVFKDFVDVPYGSDAYEAVQFIYNRGITAGTSENTYSPELSITRAQLLVMMCRAYSIKEMSGDNFYDAGNTYYTGYLAAAKQKKISNGVGANKFAPEKEITKQEMYTLLYNILYNFNKIDKNYKQVNLADYDTTNLSDWAKMPTVYLLSKGYISPKNNVLDGNSKASRADFAKLLYKVLK